MGEDDVTRLKLVAMLILNASVIQCRMPIQHSVDSATTCGSLCRPVTHAVGGTELVPWNEHMLTNDVSHATDFIALRRGTEPCELPMRLGVGVDRSARGANAKEIVGISEKWTLVQKQRGGHLELREQFWHSWVAHISVVNGEENHGISRGNRGDHRDCSGRGKSEEGSLGSRRCGGCCGGNVVVVGRVVGGSVVVSTTVVDVFWPGD